MKSSTSLIRIRFPYDLVERLDRLAERLRLKNRRTIPRAALIRALVKIHIRDLDEHRQELTAMLGADPVRRGREKKQSKGKGQNAAAPPSEGRWRHPIIRTGAESS